jgi:hypothetical protein
VSGIDVSCAVQAVFQHLDNGVLLGGWWDKTDVVDNRLFKTEHRPSADTLGLPFQHEVNTGFGILAKTYLDAAVYHNNDSITEANMSTLQVVAAKQEAMLFVEQTFSSIRNPIQEIERGFRFWDTVSFGLVLRV